jgi:hypothetical protein
MLNGNILVMTNVLPFLALAVILAIAGVAISELLRQFKRRQREWHELVAQLQPVDFAGVTSVAHDYLTPQRGQIEMEPAKIWTSLGGYEGLRRMRENADVMLELAAHAQQWNFEEAAIVTERMRLDAITLRRAVRRVEFGMIPIGLLKHFRFTLPLHAQEASSAYYLMRLRLLSLYQTSHEGRYPALAACL